jgi:LmbE family N-acetylglucosaminyl deacetylase
MVPAAGADTNIYLSPHYDDIAFSLGARVAAEPGGRLINLFTRSGYVAGTPVDHWPDAATIERVMVLRQAEDMAFSQRHGLERLDLGLDEPPVRKRTPWDLTGLAEDIEQVRAPLNDLLAALPAGSRIFCPAGIGGHVNHLAVRAVVIELLPELQRRGEVLFYEDLPYASSSRARRRWLPDLRRALAGWRIRRQAWPAGADKLAMVNLYPSQHGKPATSLRRFSPRTLWPIGPHEAVWQVITPS